MKKKPEPARKKKKKIAREASAGGVVRRGADVLLVKVKNLQGIVVWTFPKGHLEAGESSEQAALREVREETGWNCKITGKLGGVQYWFQRGDVLVRKTVDWFAMDPVIKEGKHDPVEIMDTKWLPLDEAADLIVYPSDKKIVEKLKSKSRKDA